MADRDPRFAPAPEGWGWDSSRSPNGRLRRGAARVVHLFPLTTTGDETRTLCDRDPEQALEA